MNRCWIIHNVFRCIHVVGFWLTFWTRCRDHIQGDGYWSRGCNFTAGLACFLLPFVPMTRDRLLLTRCCNFSVLFSITAGYLPLALFLTFYVVFCLFFSAPGLFICGNCDFVSFYVTLLWSHVTLLPGV